MPPDRLSTLLRQRALLSQHLAWLDAEIASAHGETPFTPTTAIPPSSSLPAAGTSIEPGSNKEMASAFIVETPTTALAVGAEDSVSLANQKADQIIASYSTADRFDPAAAKRGCILLAVGAGLVLVGIFAVWYYFHYKR